MAPWDEWTNIEASQQAADLADDKRRQERAAHRLRVVPDPVTTAHDALRTTEPPEDAVGWQSTTWGRETPLYAESDPRNPDRPKVDVVTGLRLYVEWLAHHLESEEDTDE